MDIKYEVILTTQAKMELNNIYKYISNFLFAPKAAQKFIDKFKTSILRLEHLPKSCSIISEDINSKYEYRKLIINNYIVIYSIDEENLPKSELFKILIRHSLQTWIHIVKN